MSEQSFAPAPEVGASLSFACVPQIAMVEWATAGASLADSKEQDK